MARTHIFEAPGFMRNAESGSAVLRRVWAFAVAWMFALLAVLTLVGTPLSA
jgi:hypothetical protein